MGNAQRRGTYEERKAAAIAAGRVKMAARPAPKGPKRNELFAIVGIFDYLRHQKEVVIARKLEAKAARKAHVAAVASV